MTGSVCKKIIIVGVQVLPVMNLVKSVRRHETDISEQW